MRLFRRLYRLIAGKCLTCGTRITALEVQMGLYYCLHCEANLNK